MYAEKKKKTSHRLARGCFFSEKKGDDSPAVGRIVRAELGEVPLVVGEGPGDEVAASVKDEGDGGILKAGCNSKAEPFKDFAEVIRAAHEMEEATVGDGVAFPITFLSSKVSESGVGMDVDGHAGGKDDGSGDEEAGTFAVGEVACLDPAVRRAEEKRGKCDAERSWFPAADPQWVDQDPVSVVGDEKPK